MSVYPQLSEAEQFKSVARVLSNPTGSALGGMPGWRLPDGSVKAAAGGEIVFTPSHSRQPIDIVEDNALPRMASGPGVDKILRDLDRASEYRESNQAPGFTHDYMFEVVENDSKQDFLRIALEVEEEQILDVNATSAVPATTRSRTLKQILIQLTRMKERSLSIDRLERALAIVDLLHLKPSLAKLRESLGDADHKWVAMDLGNYFLALAHDHEGIADYYYVQVYRRISVDRKELARIAMCWNTDRNC